MVSSDGGAAFLGGAEAVVSREAECSLLLPFSFDVMLIGFLGRLAFWIPSWLNGLAASLGVEVPEVAREGSALVGVDGFCCGVEDADATPVSGDIGVFVGVEFWSFCNLRARI